MLNEHIETYFFDSLNKALGDFKNGNIHDVRIPMSKSEYNDIVSSYIAHHPCFGEPEFDGDIRFKHSYNEEGKYMELKLIGG